MHPSQIVLSPVQSESSFAGLEHQRYTFRVHKDATKTQVKHAIESLYKVSVTGVATTKTPAKPKRRGLFRGTRPGYKKAVVQLKRGDSIQIFEGVH